MLARIPVVTAVSPHYRNERRQFSGPLSVGYFTKYFGIDGVVVARTKEFNIAIK